VLLFLCCDVCVCSDQTEAVEALRLLSEKYTPGRWEHIKQPSKAELLSTGVVRIPLVEVSAKVRNWGPSDDAEDYTNPKYWAGLIPLKLFSLPAIPDPKLLPGIPIPKHVMEFNAVPPLPQQCVHLISYVLQHAFPNVGCWFQGRCGCKNRCRHCCAGNDWWRIDRSLATLIVMGKTLFHGLSFFPFSFAPWCRLLHLRDDATTTAT
jgi:hypothetical protein